MSSLAITLLAGCLFTMLVGLLIGAILHAATKETPKPDHKLYEWQGRDRRWQPVDEADAIKALRPSTLQCRVCDRVLIEGDPAKEKILCVCVQCELTLRGDLTLT